MSASLETKAVCVSDVATHTESDDAAMAVMMTALPSSIVDIITEFVGDNYPIYLRQRKYDVVFEPRYARVIRQEDEKVHVTDAHFLQIHQARKQFKELMETHSFVDKESPLLRKNSCIKNYTFAKCFVELVCSTKQPLQACELVRKYFNFAFMLGYRTLRTACTSDLHRIIEHLRSFNMLAVDDYYSDSERKFRRAMIARVTYRLRHWAISDDVKPEAFYMITIKDFI